MRVAVSESGMYFIGTMQQWNNLQHSKCCRLKPRRKSLIIKKERFCPAHLSALIGRSFFAPNSQKNSILLTYKLDYSIGDTVYGSYRGLP